LKFTAFDMRCIKRPSSLAVVDPQREYTWPHKASAVDAVRHSVCRSSSSIDPKGETRLTKSKFEDAPSLLYIVARFFQKILQTVRAAKQGS